MSRSFELAPDRFRKWTYFYTVYKVTRKRREKTTIKEKKKMKKEAKYTSIRLTRFKKQCMIGLSNTGRVLQ